MNTPAKAASYIWTGASGNNNWATSGNWNPQGTPGSSDYDIANFNNEQFGASSTISIGGLYRLNQFNSLIDGQKTLNLNSTSSGLLFGGTGAIMSLNGEMTLNLNASFTATEDFTIQARRSNLIVGKTFAANDKNVTVDNDAGTRVEMRGTVSNVANLTKVGAGTLVLSTTNRNIDQVEVRAGALHLGADDSLDGANLVLGDDSNPDVGVTLEALNGDRTLTNHIDWVNNSLIITGEHAIILTPDNPLVINLDSNRSIDVALQASLVFGEDITTTGSGSLTKTGQGLLEIQGHDHSFSSVSIMGGIIAVTSTASVYTLGSSLAGGNPLGAGDIVIDGGTSRLELSPGANATVNLEGSMALDHGAVFELKNRATTYVKSGAVLDGGTGLSTNGAESMMIFRGDIYLDGGSLMNTPNIQLGSNATVYNSATTGSAGDLIIGFEDIANDKVTLDASVTGLEAEWIKISKGSSLILGADGQIINATRLELGDAAHFITKGYGASFSGLTWTDSNVWADRSTITLSNGLGTGAGSLYFRGTNILGGSGNLVFDGWVDGSDRILFDYDVSSESWFNNIVFYGYNDQLGWDVVSVGGGQWELKPTENASATPGVFVWNSQAYRGEGVSKSTNTDGSLGGNWDLNRVPIGTGIEMVFSNLDSSLTNKTILLDLPAGEVVLGKLTIADNVTGVFNLSGSNSIRFDNNGAQAEIYVGTKALSSSNAYKIRNNIFLSDKGLKFDGRNGVLEVNGAITGTSGIDVTGVSGILDLRGQNTAYSGNTTVYSGVLKYYNGNALGTGSLIMEGGAIGASYTNGPVELSNRFVINADFGVRGGTTRFIASGNAANDRIDLSAIRTVTGSGTLVFTEGRDLQGTGGLSLVGSGGVVGFNVLSGNSDFSGGLILASNSNYMVGLTSEPELITGNIVFGEKEAGANYAGVGNITYNNGGNIYIIGGAGSTVDFRNGMMISASGYSSGTMRIHGQMAAIKFTNVNFSGNVSMSAYGSQIFEIGNVNFANTQSTLSLSMDREDYGSQAGDVLFRSLNGSGTSSLLGLNSFYISGLGYTVTLDDSIDLVTANTFTVNNGRLALTRDNQVGGATAGVGSRLVLNSGSILSSKGVSNTFGTVGIGGATTFELGSGGQLTLGSISSWGTTSTGTPFLMNIENSSGIWNTVANISASPEHIWLSSLTGWNDDRLAQIAFTGYTRGAEIYSHSASLWELMPSGDPAFEWIGGAGTSNTSWSTGANWFAGRIPTSVGDIAIFRDQDNDLDGKAIQLTAGNNVLSQLNFEGTKDPTFSIDSATGSETLAFAGNGGPAKILMTGYMTPTINAAMSIDSLGLLINNSTAYRTLTLAGVIRDANTANPGTLFIEGSHSATADYSVVKLSGDNTFSGGVVQRGGTLEVDHDHALGAGAYTVDGQGRFGGTSGLGAVVKTLANDLHLKATGSDASTQNNAWILTSSIAFNDDRADDVDGYLYGPKQIITFDNGGKLTFGANYTLADAAGNGPAQLVLKSGGTAFPTIEFLGQNTFSGGVMISGINTATISVGSSSRLVNAADPSQGILSGPLGTGTITFGTNNNHVLAISNPAGTENHYVLHNNFDLLTGTNSKELSFHGGRGSLTLDSIDSFDLNGIERNIYTGMSSLSQSAYTLVMKSKIDGLGAALNIWGDGYVRFSNSANEMDDFRIGLKEYSNGSGVGRVSLGADNTLGNGRIGVYGWTNYAMDSTRQSFLQAYSGRGGTSTRTLNNLFDFNTGLVFESLIEDGGIAGGTKLGGIVRLALNGTGQSDLNPDSSGNAGVRNQRTFTINSTPISGSGASAIYNSVIVSFGKDHDLVNGGLYVDSNSTNYTASLRGLGGELELLGSKSFAGFTNNGSGSAFLGAGYDTDSTKYALVLGNYARVTTTLDDKDMVIGAVDADGSRITPFGQGEILLNGTNSLLLVRTGDNQKDVYLEDGLFEMANGTFEVTGGGDIILGRRGNGNHFNQSITGRNGQDGLGILKTSNGSRILVDAGDKTVTLRANMAGQMTLQSGSLSTAKANSLAGITDLTFNGGRLALNQTSQTLSAGSTISLGSSTMSTLDFGGLPASGNVVLTAGTLGSWDTGGKLVIKGWNGDIAGNGRSRFLLNGYTDPSNLYLGNVLFEGYGMGARLVQFGSAYEILPYAATYIWKGTQNTSWATSSNWKDNDVPNIINASVTFGDEAVRNQSQITSNMVLGDLIFSGTNNQQFEITPSAGGLALVMEHTPGSGREASIVMIGNSDAKISTSMELRSHLDISNEQGADLELSGNIYNRSGDARKVTKNGGGILTMSGSNTFTGGMELSEGTLRINVNEAVSGNVTSGAVGTGAFTIKGGTIEAAGSNRTVSNRIVMSGDFTVGGGNTLTLAHTPGSTKSAITKDVTINVLENSALVIGASNTFSSNGKITKEGLGALEWHSTLDNMHTRGVRINNGTMVLSAANNYSGGTEMAGGVLAIANNTSLGSADSAIAVVGNSTLRIDANLTGVANNAVLGAGNTLTIQTANAGGTSMDATLSGVVSGTGALVKTGGGTLTLTGENTYTGATTVSAGTLQIGNGLAAGSIVSNVGLASGTHLVFNHNDELAYTGIASGSGDLTKIGTGTLVLSGSNTYTGGTSLEEGAITVASNSALGTGNVDMDDDTQLNYNSAVSLANTIDMAGAGRLNVASGSATQSGVISGEDLDKIGSGTLVLTGANDYEGDTTVSEGVLQLGDGGTTGSILAIADDGKLVTVDADAALAFNRSDDFTYLGSITGEGQVIQRGTNTVTFTTAQDYEGGSIVENGVLKIRDDGTVDNNVEILADGTFMIGEQGGDYTFANTFSGSGTIAVNISEDMDRTASGYDPAMFDFGTDGATQGANFTGMVEMRNTRYIIDDNALAFLNAGGSGVRTTNGSIGGFLAIDNTDPLQRKHHVDGLVDFAGGEVTWYFDASNQAQAYISAGTISISAPTVFKLDLGQSLAAICADSLTDTSLFCGYVNGTESLLLGLSADTITGSANWANLEIYVNGHLQYDNSVIRQSVSHVSPEVAKGVFDWTVYPSTYADDVNDLRVGYRLNTMEIFHDKTLEILLSDTETNNEFNIGLTDYDLTSSQKDTRDLDVDQRIGSGHVLFSDRSTSGMGIKLNGANSYTGWTTIDSNTRVILGSDQGMGSAAQHTTQLIANQSGSVLDLNGKTAHVGGIQVANGGSIHLGDDGNGLLNIAANTANGKPEGNGGGSVSGNNALTGNGSIQLGLGTLTISDSNAGVEAETGIADGATLHLTHVNALGQGGTAGDITVDGTLQVNASGTLDNMIAGSSGGLWQKMGSGQLTSAQDNTFAGKILVSEGTLTLTGSNASVGETELTDGTILELGQDDSAGSTRITLSGDTGTIRALDDITLANEIAITASGTIDTNGMDVTSDGLITGAGSLNVNGAGTLNINRANNFAGSSTIDGSEVILGAGGHDGLSRGNVALTNSSVLELGFSDQTFDNALTGASTETVNVTGTNITLAPTGVTRAVTDNNSFEGVWNITGSANISGLTTNVIANIGADSTVDLNDGILNLATTDDADFTFANKMRGTGTLNVTLGGNDNNFYFTTASVKAGGNAFTGTLSMLRGLYRFSVEDATRTGVLANGTLELGTSGSNSVGGAVLDGDYQIGGLAMEGGTLKVDTAENGGPKGTLTVDQLKVDGGGTVALNVPDSISPTAASGTLFDDDGGPGSQQLQIVKAVGEPVPQHGAQLNFTNYDGSIVGNPDIEHQVQLNDGNGTDVAEAFYGYVISVKGDDTAASGNNGIYLGYGMNRINSYTADNQYQLSNTATSDNVMGALLTSTAKGAAADSATVDGGFDFKALGNDDATMIKIANAGNNYTGKTIVSQGTVQYLLNNAFGKTSGLEMANGTTVDMNGKTQIGDNAIGQLTMTAGGTSLLMNGGKLDVTGETQISNNGTVNLGTTTGKLTLSGGGAITGDGALSGAGNIDLNGTDKTLAVSGYNTGLSATVDIRDANTAILDSFKGLGTGQLNLAGVVTINGAASGDLSNAIAFNTGVLNFDNAQGTQSGSFTGSGATVNLANGSEIDLTGSNSALAATDQFNIDATSALRAHQGDNLGLAAVNNGGLLTLDYAGSGDWILANALNDNGSDAGELVKEGTGTVAINQANSRTGDTTIDAGEIKLGHVDGIGSGDVDINDSILTLDSSATGTFGNDIANDGTVNLASTSLDLTSDISGSGTVNVLENANITLSGDNSDFDGAEGANWNIMSGGQATMSLAEHLGTTAGVTLDGQLTIDRMTSPVAGGYTWLNDLAGTGVLTVHLSDGAEEYNFDSSNAQEIGTNFTGTLQLGQGTFHLDGAASANTQALALATLESQEGNHTILGQATGANALGGMRINGGLIDFVNARVPGDIAGLTNDHITLVDSNGILTVTRGSVAVEAGLLNGIDTTIDTTANLLTQEDGRIGVQLVQAAAGNAVGGTADLIVIDSATGEVIPTDGTEKTFDLMVGTDKVAVGHYNFGTTLGTENDGLYVDYILTQVDIETGKNLVLDNENATGAASDFSARITGEGNLTIDATGTDNKIISLSNGDNTFTGVTRVTDGTTLQAATTIDNIIATSGSLVLGNGSTFDLNGTNQQVNSLAGAGQVLFNGDGTFTVNNEANGNSVYGGDIYGNGQMVKQGEGTLTLQGGRIQHRKGTIVEEGTLNLNDTLSHSLTPIVTLHNGANASVNGGSIGASGDTLFAMEDSTGSLTVSNITNYTVGREDQRLIDATGTGQTEFTLDNVKDARGDVYAETDAHVNMSLKNGTTYTGKIDPVALNVDNSSTWNMTANSIVTELNNNGTVDFMPSTDGTYKTLAVTGNMANDPGNTGTFRMNVSLAQMQNDLITVDGNASGSYQIMIRRDQVNDLTDAQSFALKLVDVNGTNNGEATGQTEFHGSTDVRMRRANVQAGDLNGNNQEDWFLVYDMANDPGNNNNLSNTGRGILGMSEISLLWFTQMDSLVKRMGELRMNQPLSDKWVDNFWVRSYGAQYNVDSDVIGSRYKDYIYGADIGVDHGWQLNSLNRLYAGVFAGYGGARKDFNLPGTRGDIDSFYFGAYGTWINDRGYYVDMVVKAQHLYNDFKTLDDSYNRTSGDYNQWAFGASIEAGRMITFKDNWYVEPQAQASWFHSEGVGYYTEGANSFKTHVAGGDSLNFRYGANAGRIYSLGDNGQLQPYVKVHGVHQFSRGGHVRTDDGQWRARMEGSSVRAGAGVIWQINDRNQVHFDYEAAFGEKYTMPWGVNMGYRYQF